MNWLVFLPQVPQADGYTETTPDVVLRTPMDSGPDKVRLKDTAGPTMINLTFRMSGEQRIVFDRWFRDVLKFGTVTFKWAHWLTGEINNYRIVGQPQYAAVAGQRGLHWDVAMAWERLP